MPESGDFLRQASSFSRELAAVPRGLRRLGFLVVAAAVLLGTTVLLLLFFYSLYVSDPPAMQARFIDTLSREASGRLDPEAMDRAEELEDAFRTLSDSNEAGTLGWQACWAVMRAYAEASADGTLDSDDLDALIESIREAVTGAASPRRL